MAGSGGQYAGSAFVQLDRAARDSLWNRVEEMKAKKPPTGMKRPGTEWVRPGLIGRVKYLRGEGGLRHASLTGVKEQRVE